MATAIEQRKHLGAYTCSTLLIIISFTATFTYGATPVANPDSLVATTSTESSLIAASSSLLVPEWFTKEVISGVVEAGDFIVGPGRTAIELLPGESRTFELSVTNRISNDRLFELVVEDIAGSQDPNKSITVLGDVVGPYSIRDYISFPNNTFALGLGERARLPVTITIPRDAEPGGYYGAIFVSTLRTDAATAVANTAQSPVIARIGSLFFITVPGAITYESSLKDIALIPHKAWYESGPITFGITIENLGSVHIVPAADISITNMFGEEVGFLEVEPWFVMPKSLRTRTVEWNREALLGRYTAEIRVARGHGEPIDTTTIVFWVLPWKIIGGVFVIIFVFFFSIRTFFRTFEFKRKE